MRCLGMQRKGGFWAARAIFGHCGLIQTDDDRSSDEVFFIAAGEAHGYVSFEVFGGRVVGIGRLATAKQSDRSPQVTKPTKTRRFIRVVTYRLGLKISGRLQHCTGRIGYRRYWSAST